MSTRNGDGLQDAENIKEQQRLHRNMLRRNRYAQMSPEKKQSLLSQQQARRAESKRRRLIQQQNSTMSWPEVATHDRNPNSQSISTPTSPTNGGQEPKFRITTVLTRHASSISSTQTIACTPIFEVGSTSRRTEATEKYSNESTASNIGKHLYAITIS
ncbi:hypothetical protein T459_29641 [Capsicum annuum]|uniref:Uncharacterized protein n=1 Tax=Capsicum annuum TaxID=4072 RepID=A0A2G2Y622_CAPAN|nr:hypothetical protein T459_29641 [Capsicum annuum]